MSSKDKRPNDHHGKRRKTSSNHSQSRPPCSFEVQQSVHSELRHHYQDRKVPPQSVPSWKLRSLANTPIGRRTLNIIIDGVISRPWNILPPKEDRGKESAWQRAAALAQALEYPNREDNDDYVLVLGAVLQDLLVLGYGAIERAPGSETTQPFWLWDVNAAWVKANPDWCREEAHSTPRYYFGEHTQSSHLVSLFDSELFLVQHQRNTYDGIPPSPFAVAYDLVASWLGICNYQNSVVGKASRNQLIGLLNAKEDDLEAFQAYWTNEVVGSGHHPIANHNVNISRLGAEYDRGLFLKYEKKLLRCFALAFNLTLQDLGFTEPAEDTTSASVRIDMTFREAICPYIKTLNRVLTEQIVSYFEPGFEFRIETSEPLSEDVAANLSVSLFQGGSITRNEARRKIGMPEIGPSGDVYVDGSRD